MRHLFNFKLSILLRTSIILFFKQGNYKELRPINSKKKKKLKVQKTIKLSRF